MIALAPHPSLPVATPTIALSTNGLELVGGGLTWIDPTQSRIHADHVRLQTNSPLHAGWHEFALTLRSEENLATRRRLEVTFESIDGDSRPVLREAFAWNRSLSESFLFHLELPVSNVRIDIWDAGGLLHWEECVVRPIQRSTMLLRAVREKVRLVRAYRCFGSALGRAGRLVMRGRFRELGTKLVKGLNDSRTMQLNNLVNEADGAWWRRHSLPAGQADDVRAAIDAMPIKPRIALLLPIDPERLDHTRHTIQSLHRQLYSPWEVHLAASGPAGLQPFLNAMATSDKRFHVTRTNLDVGLPTAIGQAISWMRAEHVMVLSPGIELAEDALYHFAEAHLQHRDAPAIGAMVHGRQADAYEELAESNSADPTGRVWLTPIRELRDSVPETLTPGAIGWWVAGAIPTERRVLLEQPLAYPVEDRVLFPDGIRPIGGRPIMIAGDLHGLTGYDHLTYALLKGLPSSGASVSLHSSSMVRAHLLPPGHTIPKELWKPGIRQIIVSLPTIDTRYALTSQTAVYTMWETERLEPAWVKRLNQTNLVIVPSRWGKETFTDSGVTVPIEVAPLGYDPLVFHPGPMRMTNICTFGTAGALAFGGLRKNAQLVIDLFRRAFPDSKDVRLKIKITPNSPNLETYDDPRVQVLRAVLPPAELAEWYRSLTAYVNASAGEGFGLHLIETMACGRPVISPHYSGLTEYFDESVGFVVGHTLEAVNNSVYRGRWAEPNHDDIVSQMRAIYDNPMSADEIGAHAAVRAKSFTWKASGKQLLDGLRKHGYLE